MGQIAAGAYAREIRNLRGFTQQKIAECVGISDDRIWQFESGRGTISHVAFLRYAYAVRLSIDDMYQLVENEYATVEQAVEMAREHVAAQDAAATALLRDLEDIALERTSGDASAARALLLDAIEKTIR